jgi:DNA helicase-2/ATP-dependent DNA helicase PcrA
MIDQGINPKDILTVTFGKVSTKDMAERFEKLFGSEYNVRFSTIHSLAYSILREYNYKHRINVTLIEEKDDKAGERPTKTKVLRQIYRIVNDAFITDEEIEDLANKVGFVKNMMLKKNEFWKYNLGIKNFEEIFEKYERYKRKNSFIDYDDMLTMCLDILGKDRKILEKYQYKFIQVDEAQDTSKVQHEIIRVLGSKSRNVFYVADDDQSIYGFRGAYPEFLLSIKDTYEDVKVLYMEQNFRSTPEIVSACNEFIKENEVRFNKEMFTETRPEKKS